MGNQFFEAFLRGEAESFHGEKAYENAKSQFDAEGHPAPLAGGDGQITEDCLFLDVIVPTAVYDRRGKEGAGAPVLVWYEAIPTPVRRG